MANTDRVVREMERRGGSFIQALAAAWRKADLSNRAIIEKAFGHEFDRYALYLKPEEDDGA